MNIYGNKTGVKKYCLALREQCSDKIVFNTPELHKCINKVKEDFDDATIFFNLPVDEKEEDKD